MRKIINYLALISTPKDLIEAIEYELQAIETSLKYIDKEGVDLQAIKRNIEQCISNIREDLEYLRMKV
ncbi:MAG: hypothetical protein J7M16_01200 [Anaerolineae bacterium]|nr:hypothetical protein [Anaerolineae bacterium]